MLQQIKIQFTSADKGMWLATICNIHNKYAKDSKPSHITLEFSLRISVEQIEPVHLVTLACIIQYLIDRGHQVFMSTAHKALYDYIYNDLDFSAYWRGGKNHVSPHTSDNIFNLWRIVDSEKDLYAKNVESYFNKNYFINKDLSALSVSLVEAFYNVFDHANANKNAFSLLHYDKYRNNLLVAIADFGIGIPESVRNFNSKIASDLQALEWALEDHSTVKSTTHNKGLGMGNILAVASSARVFSGNGLIVIKGKTRKSLNINFKFPGTLIYLDIDLSSFDDIEILETFNW